MAAFMYRTVNVHIQFWFFEVSSIMYALLCDSGHGGWNDVRGACRAPSNTRPWSFEFVFLTPQSARSAEFDRHTWARCNIHTWMTSSHLAFAGRSRDPSNWTQAPRPLDRPRPSALHAWDLNSLTIDKKTVFFKTQVMISIIDHMSVLSVFLSVLCRISVLIRIR